MNKPTSPENPPVDPAIGRRLVELRNAKGIDTTKDAARQMGAKYDTYLQHETGRRPPSRAMQQKYAKFYGVEAAYIMYGDPETNSPETLIEVVGVLSHNGRIVAMPKGSTLPRYVPAPSDNKNHDLLAILVVDNEMFPTFCVGDIIYYSKSSEDSKVAALAGRRCVVEMADGEKLIRFVTLQPDGLFTLVSYGGQMLANVALVACDPIVSVQMIGTSK
jgi:transcriptional regulator with XRE-family HTH domain